MVGKGHRERAASDPEKAMLAPRACDAKLAEYAAFAIEDLTMLIGEAVRASDDDLVLRLDAVLRRIEAIAQATAGSPNDRRAH